MDCIAIGYMPLAQIGFCWTQIAIEMLWIHFWIEGKKSSDLKMLLKCNWLETQQTQILNGQHICCWFYCLLMMIMGATILASWKRWLPCVSSIGVRAIRKVNVIQMDMTFIHNILYNVYVLLFFLSLHPSPLWLHLFIILRQDSRPRQKESLSFIL